MRPPPDASSPYLLVAGEVAHSSDCLHHPPMCGLMLNTSVPSACLAVPCIITAELADPSVVRLEMIGGAHLSSSLLSFPLSIASSWALPVGFKPRQARAPWFAKPAQLQAGPTGSV